MRIFSVYPLGSADEHRIDIDVHALYGHACGLGDLVADFVHNTAAQGVEIHAVIDGDVKHGTVMAGQIAGMIKKQQTCKEIIDEVMGQAEKLLHR